MTEEYMKESTLFHVLFSDKQLLTTFTFLGVKVSKVVCRTIAMYYYASV